MINANLHRAYDRIDVSKKMQNRAQSLHESLDYLLKLGQDNESALLRSLKPSIAVSLKWRFDYLCKTFESPFELENDVKYWINVLEMLEVLGDQGWYQRDGQHKPVDPWARTAQGFDLGWTTTTEGEKFEVSKKIAQERLEQIYQILGGKGYFEGKEILDSGCGPGRYVDEMRKLGPKRIVALDQGERLVSVLKQRFESDSKVTVVKGTCEDLSQFADNSFDFVMSNGVLHHTKSDIHTMLKDHHRVLRSGGGMFIMLVGKGGLELKIWEFVRGFLNDVPLSEMIQVFQNRMSPLRLQGIVDHMYGEYQETSREDFESWCKPLFKKVTRAAGIPGLDVTPEIYKNDPYYSVRFGSGHLRYVLEK